RMERGLNLTWEVRDGIKGHSKGLRDLVEDEAGLPVTLEAQVVRLADRIAYVHHDTDDAIRARVIEEAAVPERVKAVLGVTRGRWLDTLVHDAVAQITDRGAVALSPAVREALNLLKDFLTVNVYLGSQAKAEVGKAQNVLAGLFEYCLAHPEDIPQEYRDAMADGEPLHRAACDYLAGMTDRYAIRMAQHLLIPRTWAFF
ncbi:MAG: deoxyguanosinetriphosphate triphosphohydrolase, partial [Armatimonadetes bacterium]|nr:deoxyguanosinetriphosphate triphosphohydrolase [Armatimonadota bacterium]